MCRLFDITSEDPVSPMVALEALDVMREGHDGSGVGLFLRDLGGAFEDIKDAPILSGIFSEAEKASLERKLNEFEYRSSTQIFIITLEDNGGYSVSDLAPRIGEAWGVGQQGKDNGLLMILDMQARDVFIATGYGLEEYIPDITAGRIVQHELIPNFKNGDYYAGVDAAVDVMISLLDGKFTAEAPDELTVWAVLRKAPPLPFLPERAQLGPK